MLTSSLFVLLLAQAAPPPSPGPIAPALSRRDAVALALAANPRVQKSLFAEKELEGRVREATADALPEFTVTGLWTRYRDPSFLNSSSFDNFPPELRDTLNPEAANLNDGAATLKQTLFSFKLRHAINAAHLGRKYGAENIVAARQQTALEAVQAYDSLLLAREKTRVAEKAVRQKEVHLESVKNRRAAGVATELDELRSDVDLANQKAQLLRIQGEERLAQSQLNAVMLRPLDTPVDPTDSLEAKDLDTTLEAATAEALATRAELRAADLTDQIYDQVEDVTRAEHLPKLDFIGAWGYSVRRPQNFLQANYAKWNANVVLSVPVFDGFRTSGKVAQVKAQRAQAVEDRKSLENQIRLQARDAWERLRVARSVLDAATLNVSQAQKALDMVQANYGYGAATTLDVLDTQAALTLAESIRAQALYAHADARATLRYVMGRDPLDPGPEESHAGE